jgi:hypothetical protein
MIIPGSKMQRVMASVEEWLFHRFGGLAWDLVDRAHSWLEDRRPAGGFAYYRSRIGLPPLDARIPSPRHRPRPRLDRPA